MAGTTWTSHSPTPPGSASETRPRFGGGPGDGRGKVRRSRERQGGSQTRTGNLLHASRCHHPFFLQGNPAGGGWIGPIVAEDGGLRRWFMDPPPARTQGSAALRGTTTTSIRHTTKHINTNPKDHLLRRFNDRQSSRYPGRWKGWTVGNHRAWSER